MLILLTIVLSFIGSLPFGMINLNVLYTDLTKGRQAAIALALGAALIECVQGIVAAIVFSRLIELTSLTTYFRLAAVLVFIGIAIYYFMKPKVRPTMDQVDSETASQPFVKGVLLSSFNFLAIPFWLTILMFMSDKIEIWWDVIQWIIFGVGAGIGGFLASMTYVFVGNRVIDKNDGLYRKLDYIMAALFLVLAIVAYFI